MDEFGDLLYQLGLVDLVRQLCHDDTGPLGTFIDLDFGFCPKRQETSSRFIGVFDPLRAIDKSGGGEIGPRNAFHEFANGHLGPFNKGNQPGDNLT